MGFYEKLRHRIRFWLLRRLPNCQQTVVTISQSMERPLKFSERIKMKVHLWICAWCQWYMEHLQLLHDVSRAKGSASPDFDPGPGLSEEARERIRRNLTSSK